MMISLDATKAFDPVDYFKLFDILFEKNSKTVLRSLQSSVNRYLNHKTRVSWHMNLSICVDV